MAMPFNIERRAKIDITIPGYDAKRLLEKQREKLKTPKTPGAAATPVAKSPPVVGSTPGASDASDADFDALNAALKAGPEPLKELFTEVAHD